MIKARQGSSLGVCACCPCLSTSLGPRVDCQWQAQRYTAHPHTLVLFHIPFRSLYLTPTRIMDIALVPPTIGGLLHYNKGDLGMSAWGNFWATLGVGGMTKVLHQGMSNFQSHNGIYITILLFLLEKRITDPKMLYMWNIWTVTSIKCYILYELLVLCNKIVLFIYTYTHTHTAIYFFYGL